MFCFTPNLSGVGGTFEQEDFNVALEKGFEEARDQSIFPIGTESTSFDNDDGDYHNIDIKVQVLGLMNGLIMETTKRETKRIKSKKSKLLGDEQVFAVVSGFSEVPSKRAVVATHLPSLEIETQGEPSDGKTHNLMAVWPADFDPNGNQTSSVTFTRKMKMTPIDSLAGVQKYNSRTCLYTTENLILAISLRKGNEIITLGTTMVHFTGREKNSTQTNLPVKTTKHSVKKAIAQMKGKKMKKKDEKSKLKLMTPVSFKSDPSRSYFLGEDSVISMLIESKKSDEPSPEKEEGGQSGKETIVEDVEDTDAGTETIVEDVEDTDTAVENADDHRDGNEYDKEFDFTDMTPTFTQEDILLDLAISDEFVSKEKHFGSLGIARNHWRDDLQSIPFYNSSDSADTDVNTPVKEILVISPNPTPKNSRNLNVDISAHAMASATDSYVLAPNPSATDNYICSTKSNDRPKTLGSKEQETESNRSSTKNSNIFKWMPSPKNIDQPENQCSSTKSSNIFTWMPTPKEIAHKFNFANFEEAS
jgi:hypothetical protein